MWPFVLPQRFLGPFAYSPVGLAFSLRKFQERASLPDPLTGLVKVGIALFLAAIWFFLVLFLLGSGLVGPQAFIDHFLLGC